MMVEVGRNLLSDTTTSDDLSGGRNLLAGPNTDTSTPKPKEKDKVRTSPDFSAVGKSALEQGLFGLAAPEATYALGSALKLVPPGVPYVGVPAQMAGTALQLGAPFVGRIGPAITSAIGGATGETVGQAAEMSKYTKPFADTARVLTEFATPTVLSKAGTGFKNFLVGTTTDEIERLAKIAKEKYNINLEPRQLRQDSPKGSPGFLGYAVGNQNEVNQAVSNLAGRKSNNLGSTYVKDRLESLGNSYDQIFGRKNGIRIDRQLVSDMNDMAAFERSVSPADVRSVNQTTSNLTNKFLDAEKQSLGKIQGLQVDGTELQRLRSNISNIARNHPDGNVRKTAGQFVEKIDNNIARNHPDLFEKLQETNRQYAVTKALEDLNASGGVQGGNLSLEQLGKYLATNVYGFGSGTTSHPLYELGQIGKETKLRGRFEGVESGDGLVGGTISKLEQLLNLPGRLPLARALQRGRPPQYPVAPSTTSAITAAESEVERKREGR